MRRFPALFLIIAIMMASSLSASAVSARPSTRENEIPRYSALCKLLITYQDGSAGEATGFIFGSRVLATAGHVLYDERDDRGGAVASITAIPGAYGEEEPFGRRTFTAENSTFHTPEAWVGEADWRADIGVVTADEPWDEAIRPFPLGDYRDYPDDALLDAPLTVTGYISGSYRPSLSSGRARVVRPFDLLYAFTILAGESGAPVLSQSGEVVGIQNYAANRNRTRPGAPENTYSSGARIQKEVFAYLTQFEP